MIAWIKDWTSEIIVAVIISILIEMLLPQGTNKKYVKVVTGIYILYVIVNPFLELDVTSLKFTNNIVTVNSESTVANTYIKSLEEYLKEEIETLDYEVKEVELIYDKAFNNITSVKISMESLEYKIEDIKSIVLKEIDVDENNIIIF